STIDAAYALLSLRTVLRSVSSQLELYSNNTTDTAVVGETPIDVAPLRARRDAALTFTARLAQMEASESALLFDHLTDDTGRAFDGWDLATNAPSDDDDTLDAHAAAVRGLFAAFLASGDVRYRERAMLVFARMERVFYDADARIYSATPAPVDDVEYTPLRFALLQSALRDVYEIIATAPGGESLALDLEARIGRLDKLVLNGWDDRNQDRQVQYPDECVNVVAGLPRGGLQMAERTLTGETGSLALPHIGTDPDGGHRRPTTDRDHDCVPEIDDAKLPAALADAVTFHIARDAPAPAPTPSPALSGACVATYAGNVSGAVAGPACATLVDGVINLDAPTNADAQPTLSAAFDLGASPSLGALSSETATHWRVDGASPVASGCIYAAGSDAIPSGDFTLTLTAVDPVPHGKLVVHAPVHAAPLTDRGPVDVESIAVDF
ncbi:MAG TPA: hypothetical protein VGO62_16760, partial [Myxococcota bacterium]